jgi:hypothetical protein
MQIRQEKETNQEEENNENQFKITYIEQLALPCNET